MLILYNRYLVSDKKKILFSNSKFGVNFFLPVPFPLTTVFWEIKAQPQKWKGLNVATQDLTP
jgi:hypothetical protein